MYLFASHVLHVVTCVLSLWGVEGGGGGGGGGGGTVTSTPALEFSLHAVIELRG